jgi:hypothetical protein
VTDLLIRATQLVGVDWMASGLADGLLGLVDSLQGIRSAASRTEAVISNLIDVVLAALLWLSGRHCQVYHSGFGLILAVGLKCGVQESAGPSRDVLLLRLLTCLLPHHKTLSTTKLTNDLPHRRHAMRVSLD